MPTALGFWNEIILFQAFTEPTKIFLKNSFDRIYHQIIDAGTLKKQDDNEEVVVEFLEKGDELSLALPDKQLTFGIIGLITGKENKPTRGPKTSSSNKRL